MGVTHFIFSIFCIRIMTILICWQHCIREKDFKGPVQKIKFYQSKILKVNQVFAVMLTLKETCSLG